MDTAEKPVIEAPQLVLQRYANGGWTIEEFSPHRGLGSKPIGSFTTAEDMIAFLGKMTGGQA